MYPQPSGVPYLACLPDNVADLASYLLRIAAGSWLPWVVVVRMVVRAAAVRRDIVGER